MADNLSITPGSGKVVAADDVGGIFHQRVKISVGGDGSAADLDYGQENMAGSLPVVLANNQTDVPITLDGEAVDTELPAAVALADGAANPTAPAVGAVLLLYNGSTLDRQRGNTELTLLSSAARTATTSSTDQVNYNARGVMVFFSITAIPGTDTVTLTIEAKDPIAGTYEALLAGVAESATGTKCYLVYPGASAAANGVDVVNGFPLPRTWRVTVTHSAAGSFTYSVAASLIV